MIKIKSKSFHVKSPFIFSCLFQKHGRRKEDRQTIHLLCPSENCLIIFSGCAINFDICLQSLFLFPMSLPRNTRIGRIKRAFTNYNTFSNVVYCLVHRRMFPSLKFLASNLKPHSKYIFLVDILPIDDHRYRFVETFIRCCTDSLKQ